MNLKPSFLVFSVFESGVARETNYSNHVVMLQRLQDLVPEASSAKGSYNGVEEESIIVPWSQTVEGMVRMICRDYRQESYLVVDTAGLAALYSPDGGAHIRELGLWTSTSKAEAVKTGNWTRIGSTYYICI